MGYGSQLSAERQEGFSMARNQLDSTEWHVTELTLIGGFKLTRFRGLSNQEREKMHAGEEKGSGSRVPVGCGLTSNWLVFEAHRVVCHSA